MNTLWLREDLSFMSVRPTDRWHAARYSHSSEEATQKEVSEYCSGEREKTYLVDGERGRDEEIRIRFARSVVQ